MIGRCGSADRDRPNPLTTKQREPLGESASDIGRAFRYAWLVRDERSGHYNHLRRSQDFLSFGALICTPAGSRVISCTPVPLAEAAQRHGTTPEILAREFLRERLLPANGSHEDPVETRSLADSLAEFIGVLDSGEFVPGGAHMSERMRRLPA